ncbi:helix-turn-helix domain protein [Ignicoccus hospitalis KIN4/I]|uniref:Helix-turn-helix domain protein n=1 Tax=Ignicoccus hospitalis (strain KIN4/I / DSM 18386 / JCM 14125) TaxID=453591 RepID=A8AA32_IGNH4|nr:helix-turn-helix domain protein [Ignicoccus hospitalis KIN4/I]
MRPPKFVLDEIAKSIAGEIALSDDPGSTLKKWREIFEVGIRELARKMNVSPSVISDYEKNKRAPGSKYIKKFVRALMEIDAERDWKVINSLAQKMLGIKSKALDIYEYKRSVRLEELVNASKGYIVNSRFDPNEVVYGFIILDSLRSIEELDSKDFLLLMSMSYKKALVFTKVGTGRPPMVAVRISQIKPVVVILHKPVNLDRLAVRIAEKEGIALIVSLCSEPGELMDRLRLLDVQQPSS